MKRLFYLVLPLVLALSGCGEVEWMPDPYKPNQFSVPAAVEVEANQTVTSETFTVTGNRVAAPITVANGEYAIGGTGGTGVFTSEPGTVTAGQTVTVRHLSAATGETAVVTSLNIGGVSAVFTSVTAEILVTSDPTGTFVLDGDPVFTADDSDPEMVWVDIVFDLRNRSTTESHIAQVDFVAKDAAGKVIYEDSVQSPWPCEPGGLSSPITTLGFKPLDFAKIKKWRITAISVVP